ncbi:MAG TPA: hypothetical protein VNI61_08410 [Gemmatimonadales bacterium]|nr:hypothetical protein [Gemmatimonadales bacterium]
MTRSVALLSVSAWVMLHATSLQAQRLRPSVPLSYDFVLPADHPPEARRLWRAWSGPGFGNAPDHRWEGVVIGGVSLGIAGAIIAHGFCDYEGGRRSGCFGRTVAGGLVGAAAGAGLGGLIGGLIPKASARRATRFEVVQSAGPVR